jgi:hypothetical protein
MESVCLGLEKIVLQEETLEIVVFISPPDANDLPTSLVHVYTILGILAGIIFCFLLCAVLFLTRRHWLKGNVHFILRFISHDYVILYVVTILPDHINITVHYTDILLGIFNTLTTSVV